MGFAETGLIYFLIGIVAGIALAMREQHRLLFFLAGLFFWPLFAPFLLATPKKPVGQDRVLRALAHLDGLAEEVVAPEIARVRGMAGAMEAMSKRIAEMDAILAGPEMNESSA